MAKSLDCAVVIDVESTCWDGPPPRGEISEIIEIGLCLVDLRLLERRERRSLMVRPLRSRIGAFCRELTGITPAMVAQAPPLAEVLAVLRDEYRCGERLFASWGDYDRDQFTRNCRSYDIKYPFGPTHLNIKNLFASAFGLEHELEMSAACRHVGMTMEGTPHRGVDDAWNAARILCLLLRRMRRAGS